MDKKKTFDNSSSDNETRLSFDQATLSMVFVFHKTLFSFPTTTVITMGNRLFSKELRVDQCELLY